jgi:hypothetical protein
MKRKKVYNQFQINLILFYAISVLIVPIFIVVAYLYDLHLYTSPNYIVLIASMVSISFFVAGLFFVLSRREKTERALKPSYTKEFSYLFVLSSFGVIGVGIFYTYLGGSFTYVPHVIIPLFIVVYGIDIFLGYRFFNVSIVRH